MNNAGQCCFRRILPVQGWRIHPPIQGSLRILTRGTFPVNPGTQRVASGIQMAPGPFFSGKKETTFSRETT